MLGRDGRPKTGRSKRDVVIHANLLEVLCAHRPAHPAPDGFVFTTPNGAPVDEANFYRREWVPMLQHLGIGVRPFYNTRHTYITYLLSLGVSPLFVARQTGTSLEMIEEHYGGVTTVADQLDALIAGREEGENGNLPGTPSVRHSERERHVMRKVTSIPVVRQRAGDRGRTGDVKLGKERKRVSRTPRNSK